MLPPNNDLGCDAVTVCRTEGVVLVTVPGAPAGSRLSSVLDDLLQQRGNVFLAVELPDDEESLLAAVDLLVKVTDHAWGRSPWRPRHEPTGGFNGVPPIEP